MKVKKFRIRPRPSYVGRLCKSLLSTKKLPDELEQQIPEASEKLTAVFIPSAFFQTWSSGEFPSVFHSSVSENILDKAVAMSLVSATIGSQAEEILSETLMKGEANLANLQTAVCEESADQAFNFISRLLSDEAKDDGCEISEPVFLTDTPLVSEVLQQVEGIQDEITLDSANHLSPRFTRMAIVPWLPIRKKSKSISFSRKRST